MLAAGSPVLAAELDRWCGEGGGGCELVVDVHGPRPAVEAMLCFFYTGELQVDRDEESTALAAAVLPLAHRYQNTDLVHVLIDRLLSTISPATAVDVVQALCPLREADDQFRLAWRELCSNVSQDTETVEAFMVSLGTVLH